MTVVRLYRPDQLDIGEWRDLQSIEREAFMGTLVHRTQDEIDTLVSWGNVDRFIDSRTDPNSEVGDRLNSSQSFTHPRVAVALEDRLPIGFGYSAHNVSGETGAERLWKRLSVVKNYLWLREIAVKPGYQRQGVAKQIGRKLLRDGISLQPVTAYIWPEEVPFMQNKLEDLGFEPTGEADVRVFGPGSERVRQVRMQAPPARSVLKKL